MNSYKDKRWKRKRKNILRRDNYECRECRRYGFKTEATTVHHIYPLEEYPELALIDINLISLCSACHNLMHDRNNNTFTPLGLQWMQRIKHLI